MGLPLDNTKTPRQRLLDRLRQGESDDPRGRTLQALRSGQTVQAGAQPLTPQPIREREAPSADTVPTLPQPANPLDERVTQAQADFAGSQGPVEEALLAFWMGVRNTAAGMVEGSPALIAPVGAPGMDPERLQQIQAAAKKQRAELVSDPQSITNRIAAKMDISAGELFDDPAAAEKVVNQLMQGLGSVTTFGAVSLLSPGGAVGGVLAGLEAGAALGASEAIAAPRDQGATLDQLDKAMALGMVGGGSEIVPVEMALNLLTKGRLKPGWAKGVQAAFGAASEGGQEMFQQFMINLAEKVTTNPDKDLMDGLPGSGALGSGVGAIVNSVALLAGFRPVKRGKARLAKKIIERELRQGAQAGEGNAQAGAEQTRQAVETQQGEDQTQTARDRLAVLPRPTTVDLSKFQKDVQDSQARLNEANQAEEKVGVRQMLTRSLTIQKDKLALAEGVGKQLEQDGVAVLQDTRGSYGIIHTDPSGDWRISQFDAEGVAFGHELSESPEGIIRAAWSLGYQQASSVSDFEAFAEKTGAAQKTADSADQHRAWQERIDRMGQERREQDAGTSSTPEGGAGASATDDRGVGRGSLPNTERSDEVQVRGAEEGRKLNTDLLGRVGEIVAGDVLVAVREGGDVAAAWEEGLKGYTKADQEVIRAEAERVLRYQRFSEEELARALERPQPTEATPKPTERPAPSEQEKRIIDQIEAAEKEVQAARRDLAKKEAALAERNENLFGEAEDTFTPEGQQVLGDTWVDRVRSATTESVKTETDAPIQRARAAYVEYVTSQGMQADPEVAGNEWLERVRELLDLWSTRTDLNYADPLHAAVKAATPERARLAVLKAADLTIPGFGPKKLESADLALEQERTRVREAERALQQTKARAERARADLARSEQEIDFEGETPQVRASRIADTERVNQEAYDATISGVLTKMLLAGTNATSAEKLYFGFEEGGVLEELGKNDVSGSFKRAHTRKAERTTSLDQLTEVVSEELGREVTIEEVREAAHELALSGRTAGQLRRDAIRDVDEREALIESLGRKQISDREIADLAQEHVDQRQAAIREEAEVDGLSEEVLDQLEEAGYVNDQGIIDVDGAMQALENGEFAFFLSKQEMEEAHAYLREHPDEINRQLEEAEGSFDFGEEPEAGGTFGEENKFFTREDAEEAKRILKNPGLPSLAGNPDQWKALVKLGGFYVEGGVRNFGDFVDRLAADVGDWVRQHGSDLRELFAISQRVAASTSPEQAKQLVDEIATNRYAEQTEGTRSRIEGQDVFTDSLPKGGGFFRLRFWDKIGQKMLDKFLPAYRALYVAEKRAGRSRADRPVARDMETLMGFFYGTPRQLEEALDTGLLNIKVGTETGSIEFYTDEVTGLPVNMQFLLGAFETEQQMDLAMGLAVAKRTLELSQRFKRDHALTGIGRANKRTDVQQAKKDLEAFELLKQTAPDVAERIKEGIRRYRVFSQMFLKYGLDNGLISQEAYDKILEENQEYVALGRILDEDSIDVAIGRRGKGLANVQDPLKRVKGSSKKIRDPYATMLQGAFQLLHQSNKNIVVSSFFDALEASSQLNVDISDIAYRAKPGEKISETRKVEFFRNGKKETWVVDADVARALKGLSKQTKVIAPLTWYAKTLRWTVTHAPQFAARNVIRDAFHRIAVTRSDLYAKRDVSKFLDNDAHTKQLLNIFGGGQFGFQVSTREGYLALMNDQVSKLADTPGTHVIHPVAGMKRFWHGYNRALTEGEMFNREVEMAAAIKKAKREGKTDYEAALIGAREARGLLDFSVSGEWMQIVNQVIPFSNAAVQGLRRGAIAAKEKPIRFAARVALYVTLPEMLMRLLSVVNDYEEEYDQLPAWRRDLFWNFKVGPDFWITIPKPFEVGVIGTGIARAIDFTMFGKKNAMDGYMGSFVHSVVPLDTANIMGPFNPMFGLLSNHDLFRDKNVIPPHEFKKDVDLRKGKTRGSRLGKVIETAAVAAGAQIDARQADWVVRNVFSYFGDAAIKLSNIGADEGPAIDWSTTGFVRGDPVYGSRDVQWVFNVARRRGQTNKQHYKNLNDKLAAYFLEENSKERSARGREARQLASQIRQYWEAIGVENLK